MSHGNITKFVTTQVFKIRKKTIFKYFSHLNFYKYLKSSMSITTKLTLKMEAISIMTNEGDAKTNSKYVLLQRSDTSTLIYHIYVFS